MLAQGITPDGSFTVQEVELEPLTSQIIRVKKRVETLGQVFGAQVPDTPVVVESNIPVVVKGDVYRIQRPAD